MHILLILFICCFALLMAQQQQQQQQLHPSWLYSMPWRPLILPTATPLSGIAQLSPGYNTAPQTFPPVPEDQQQRKQQPYNLQLQQQYKQQIQQQYLQPTYPQQSILVGLFAPQLQARPLVAPPQAGHFSLPFRPSPFAGYTDDEDAGGQGNGIQEQQQLEEPPFPAHSYNKPVAERSEQSRGEEGFERAVAPLSYVYLSPSNFYNLVKS
ncbi:hypothetical protein M5D96_013378 [Drosophila gunungcola]|uniref:Uncharacterized protein n=2 Tax=Drosophila gunungcola TaxID=103775 RepID=A0A9P9YC85_9MUSC|nr:hypothetical protein M5D96_013378 [Drosophila gunungcola]